MAICEKCWADAYGRSMSNGRPQYENYRDLLKEREATPCPTAAVSPPAAPTTEGGNDD